MAKLSGLIGSGKVGKADPKVVDAMPDAPAAKALDSSAEVILPEALDSSMPVSLANSGPTLDPSITKSTVAEMAVNRIRPSPYQVRAVADSDYIETLMASIVQSGVITPIIVRTLDSSTYEVIAGHHRLEACRRLGHVTVPVVVRQMSNAQAACALTSDNFVRKELSDFERYKHAKLLKEHGFCNTNALIGEVLGVSRQLVGFLFAFDDYPPGAKAILEVNPKVLGATQAYELKDLARDEPELFTEAIALLADDKLRQNQVRKWIESRFKSTPVRMQRRQEVKIQKPGLRSTIKLTYTDREAKIQAEGLDVSKLRKLIEDNLDSLIIH
ncbi:ParB/RepB/Spo0J family partition protein [Dechloromonas sp. ZS-1]|uniref:ParB/RepB/Spo0J family partition protein n=1 Tax=Dechloromonas sp. ZS-1 TaxID=3138067 RepID=UPI0031FD0E9B